MITELSKNAETKGYIDQIQALKDALPAPRGTGAAARGLHGHLVVVALLPPGPPEGRVGADAPRAKGTT